MNPIDPADIDRGDQWVANYANGLPDLDRLPDLVTAYATLRRSISPKLREVIDRVDKTDPCLPSEFKAILDFVKSFNDATRERR